MKLSKYHLTSLSADELWALHEQVGAILSERISSEKRELEERLAKLNAFFRAKEFNDTGGPLFRGF